MNSDSSADLSTQTRLWSPRPEALHSRAGYCIGHRIGAGGFAEVFAAELRQPPLPPLPVALKRLLPGLRGDPTRKRQLRREAEIAARLCHDNIVKVYELLEIDEEPVLVMELVDGIAGSQLLRRLGEQGQSLRLPAIAYLLRGLFSALDYLETRSPLSSPAAGGGPPLYSSRPLVHADISLENLMLTATGGVKLIDFGLVEQDHSLPPLDPGQEAAEEDASLTALRQMAGKRSYAPPGAGGARPGTPTVYSDLYAAGVCAWELLTGLRFPVLPAGAAARELGSLIAFAADGLPQAGWRLLQLCLTAEPAPHRSTAAQALALIERLRAEAVSPLAMGALARTLAEPRPPSATVAEHGLPQGLPTQLMATASASVVMQVDFIDRLLARLKGAFCAHRVVALAPGQQLESAHTLCYHVQPKAAGAPPVLVGIDPGAGKSYDPLAQELLTSLLGPAQQGPSAAKPMKSQLK